MAAPINLKNRGGCGCLTIVGIVFIISLVIISINRFSSKTEIITEPQRSIFNAAASPDQDKASLRSEASKSPTNSAATALSFENQKFPLFVIVTEEVSLLNNEGKTITIPKGSTLRIDSRKSKGTLTLSLGEKLLVGNETRLLGKVKIR